jgi:hypothetical protein
MGGNDAETSWQLEGRPHYASSESYFRLLTTLRSLFRLLMMSPQAQALHEEHGHRRSRWCVDGVLISIGDRSNSPNPIQSQEPRPTKNRYCSALSSAIHHLTYLI